MVCINEKAARNMLAIASERFEREASDWWLVNGEGLKPWLSRCQRGEAVAVTCGEGLVAWLMPFPDGANFDCRGIGLWDSPGECRPAQGLHKEMDKDRYVSWFAPMEHARRKERDATPLRVASRVCLRLAGTSAWHLGVVASLEPVMVLLERGGAPIELSSLSDKWFEYRYRVVAFDDLFENGKTAYNSYISMLSRLGRTHKRIAPAEYAELKAKLTKKQ